MTTIDPETLPGLLVEDLDRAFPDFVRAFQNGVFSGALRFPRHRQDAEDVTQETFVRAYRALTSYDAGRIETLQMRPWIWTIALNLCRNRARSKARKPEGPTAAEQLDPGPGPETLAIRSSSEQEWRVRLDSLSHPQRTAVVLRHVVGLSYAEIASATTRPEGTVKTDVHRGVARLRVIVEQEGADS